MNACWNEFIKLHKCIKQPGVQCYKCKRKKLKEIHMQVTQLKMLTLSLGVTKLEITWNFDNKRKVYISVVEILQEMADTFFTVEGNCLSY